MFIDVTRPGCVRQLRLSTAAIAYLDAGPTGGCTIRLIGGESLRVEESIIEIEGRATALAIRAIELGDICFEYSPPLPASADADNTSTSAKRPASGGKRG